jgi:hypothetical protein
MVNIIKFEDITFNKNNANLLLGNGFNLSLNPNTTTYENMAKDIIGFPERYKIEKCTIEKYQEECNEETNNDNIKKMIDKHIKEYFIIGVIKASFDEIKKESIDYKKLIDYLDSFNKVYTLNYDSVLYRIYLKNKKRNKNNPNDGDIDNWVDNNEENIIKEYEFALQTKIFEKTFNEYATDTIKLTLGGDIMIKKYESHVNDYVSKKIQKYLKSKFSRIMHKHDNKNEISEKLEINDGFINGQYEGTKNQTLFYLHGAVFIFLDDENNIIKLSATNQKNILSQAKEHIKDNRHPIYILEDKADDKKKKIENNDYLKNCFDNFKQLKGDLFSFGCSFSNSDNHLLEVLNNNTGLDNLYIGAYTDDEATNINNKLQERYSQLAKKAKFYITKGFFNHIS